jgi:hypothetical protein
LALHYFLGVTVTTEFYLISFVTLRICQLAIADPRRVISEGRRGISTGVALVGKSVFFWEGEKNRRCHRIWMTLFIETHSLAFFFVSLSHYFSGLGGFGHNKGFLGFWAVPSPVCP